MQENNNIHTHYEFGNWSDYNKGFESLEKHLIDVWKTRKELFDEEEIETLINDDEEHKKPDYQPFLSLSHKSKIRARNWVGFIQDEDQLIEIYPKVFKQNTPSKESMLRHIFFWMDYCSKIKFPNTQAGLNTDNIDSFPELIIYLMASHIKTILEEKPLSLYQETEERMQMPRGRINFQRYINNSLVNGSWHQLECDHEPFLFDNSVNRIIKYCARLLEQQTKIDSNKNLLRDITFILDEVEDVPCTIHDLQRIKLNAFFEEYHIALDYCKMILEQQLYNAEAYDMKRWTMLFPMELLFEDFIAGFVKEHLDKDWKVEFQKGEIYVVDEPKVFKMKHDIFLTNKETNKETNKTIIIDTKYKLRSASDKADKKRGVSQADLYQMITYAVKRGCKDVVLVYPCSISDAEKSKDEKPVTFKIKSGFDKNHQISISVVELPFWMDGDFDKNTIIDALSNNIEKLISLY